MESELKISGVIAEAKTLRLIQEMALDTVETIRQTTGHDHLTEEEVKNIALDVRPQGFTFTISSTVVTKS